MPASQPGRHRARAARIALLYIAIAAGWVLLGDAMTASLVPDGVALWLAQTLKGTAFVLLSGALLYLLTARHEQRLAADRAGIDLVLRQLPGLLWTTDQELLITSVAGEIDGLGCDPAELVGRPVTTALKGAERREVIETGHLRALGGEAADCRVDCGTHEFGVRVEPLRDDTGHIAGAVGFALELLREVARGDESVRQAISRSRWLVALGSLTLDVAHQLKNPLFAITAALDSFEERTGDQPETARHRRILREQAERIDRLVSGLQLYGRSVQLDLRQVEVATILDSAVARRRAQAQVAGVEVTLHVDAPSLLICVDHEEIVGALERVILNAIEHSPPGGRVTVRAETDRDGTGEAVEISIIDQGPGFLAGDLERVFEPLYARRPGGAGLGLAIAERIVQAHGGRMTAANGEDGGARLTLRIRGGASLSRQETGVQTLDARTLGESQNTINKAVLEVGTELAVPSLEGAACAASHRSTNDKRRQELTE